MTNVATVTTTGTDPVSGNNSATIVTVVQPLVCATPGKDGAGGTITGIVNAYYPPATLAPRSGFDIGSTGSRCIRRRANSYCRRDLLLVIQMQDAQIDAVNTTSYGSGVPG